MIDRLLTTLFFCTVRALFVVVFLAAISWCFDFCLSAKETAGVYLCLSMVETFLDLGEGHE